jgi:putative hydrolase of the HAD superfamily
LKVRSAAHAQRVWLFDLDNTLHDAGAHVFGALHHSMNAYIQRELQLTAEQASALRFRYWQRYGATLLGLIKHHGVDPDHFLQETHLLPHLMQHLKAERCDLEALRFLKGQRILLTNAPRAYALRVLQGLGIAHLFHDVVSIEGMRMFGHWRPKPDGRMFQHLMARLRTTAHRCVLVEDTLAQQKVARGFGIKTAWMCRYARPKSRSGEVSVHHLRKPPWVCARITSIQDLRRFHPNVFRDA